MTPSPCPEWPSEDPTSLLPSIIKGMRSVEKFIYAHARHFQLKASDLKVWHGQLFREVVPVGYYAGHFRSDDLRYPCIAVNVGVGPYPGAPFSEVPNRMGRFSSDLSYYTARTDTYVRDASDPKKQLEAAAQLAAFCACKIVQIHPFINGNGRISRLAANFFLHRYGLRFALDRLRPTRPTSPSYVDAAAHCMQGRHDSLFRYILTCLQTR